MNKAIKYIALFFAIITATSCGHSSDPTPPYAQEEVDNTLILYFPWTGSDNNDSRDLTPYLNNNLTDWEKCLLESGNSSQRVVAFMASTPTTAAMFEFKRKNGVIVRDTIADYPSYSYTTTEGIATILDKAKEIAPARKYALLIGAHGFSWVPVTRSKSTTKYFGGTVAKYQTDISTLADAIALSGIDLRYILFDDCYMAAVEVAYDLRNSADYLIASTCEIMAYGMPYERIGKSLLGEPDYKSVVDEFYNFYNSYSTPCGTIAVIKLSEMDKLASVMKEVTQNYDESTINPDYIQTMDGYTPTIFYDYGDYVSHVINDSKSDIAIRFNAQLEKTVPYKSCTEYYYSMASMRKHYISDYSGLNTSAPSTNSMVININNTTSWYKATH